jgi:hypothetical protein
MNVSVLGVAHAFLQALAVLVALAAIAASARSAWRGRAAPELVGGEEARLHLAFTLGQALVVAHLAAWPLLYAYLQSLVPLVPGAMCVFGVTREGGPLAVAIQLGAPAVVFTLGAWFVCYRVYREAGKLSAMPRVAGGLALASALALAQSCAVLGFVFLPRGQVPVACCSTVFDQTGRISGPLPATLLGLEHAGPVATVALGALVMALLAAWRARTRMEARGTRLLALGPVAVASFISGVVYLFEVAAPRILGQPAHHCLFDVVPVAPAMSIGLLAFALGHFSLGWATAASAAGPHLGDHAAAAAVARDCLGDGVLLLSAYVLILAIQLAVS